MLRKEKNGIIKKIPKLKPQRQKKEEWKIKTGT